MLHRALPVKEWSDRAWNEKYRPFYRDNTYRLVWKHDNPGRAQRILLKNEIMGPGCMKKIG